MVNAIVWIAFIHSQEESNLIHMGIFPKQRFHGVAKIMKEFVIPVIAQADTDGHSRCIKLWLPFYNQTTGRRVWKAVRMPGRKHPGRYTYLFNGNRKPKKQEDHKMPNTYQNKSEFAKCKI